MADKKKGALGRRLAGLMSVPTENLVIEANRDEEHGLLRNVPIEHIQPGKYQPRRDMNVSALEELAGSIRQQGILQPIVIRPTSPHRYEIIAGERRWRAAQLAELTSIPAIIREVSDETTMAIALIENIQRENLNPLDEACAIARLIEDCAMTHQEVAEAIGKSRTQVSNLLRLLSLNNDVKLLVQRGDIELGHAKVLLGLDNSLQTQAAKHIVEKRLSVRETELLVKRMSQPQTAFQPKAVDPDVSALQERLSAKLGVNVMISHTAKGRGKMVINYGSIEELDSVLEHFA